MWKKFIIFFVIITILTLTFPTIIRVGGFILDSVFTNAIAQNISSSTFLPINSEDSQISKKVYTIKPSAPSSALKIFGSIEVKENNLPALGENTDRIPQKAEIREAVLSIDSNQYLLSNKDKINLSVMVLPGGQSINMVQAVIIYPKDKLNALEIDITNSSFSIFLKKEINTEQGLITIICGQPFPGINQKSNVADIVFEPLEDGEVNIDFLADSIVLANDGYGTDVLKDMISGNYLIIAF
jgi:hypothetical protein